MNDRDIQQLQSEIRGAVIRPGDAHYETARKVFNGAIDRHPLVIIQCTGVADVLRTVRFARSEGVDVSIRGSGHNVAGTAVCDGGIVIDLSRMQGIHIDPVNRIARADPGVTWGQFDHETQIHGLATTGGTVSTTGIAGLTLGGGIGWLMGLFGLTCDNLTSVDLVTADSRFLKVTALEHPNLFWALQGGGGNFGIVTSFEYRLHPVSQVLGGSLVFPLSSAMEVLRVYRSFTAEVVDELTVFATIYTASDGQPVVSLDLCYLGDPSSGEQAILPLRLLSYLREDTVKEMPYCQLQKMFDNPFRAGQQSYWKSTFVTALEENLLESIVSHFAQVPSTKTVLFIEHLHGAVRRLPESATAFSHRDSHYGVLIASNWLEKRETPDNVAWTRQLFREVSAFSNHRAYVNYLGEEDQYGISEAYGPDIYKRLVGVKNIYDPTNFFHMNVNVRPTT